MHKVSLHAPRTYAPIYVGEKVRKVRRLLRLALTVGGGGVVGQRRQ